MKFVVALALAAGSLAAPADASAHGFLEKDGDVLRYRAPDPGAAATVRISSPEPGVVQVADSTTTGGMDWGPCAPVTERRSRCSSRGIRLIEVVVADGNDRIGVSTSLPVRVIAGPGDDTVSGGLGGDELRGGAGSDALTGGEGRDTLDGADGNDTLRARDGEADAIVCGEGSDTLEHDSADGLSLTELTSCEARAGGEPPSDTTGPRLELRNVSRLRLRRGGTVSVDVETSEPARATLRGWVIAGRRRYPLRAASRASDAPGQSLALNPRLSRAHTAAVRRALRRGRTVRARLTVTGTDRAGNRARPGKALVRIRA